MLAAGVGVAAAARLGRPGYERITRRVRELRERPGLQEAAGVMSAQADLLVDWARGAVTMRTSHEGMTGAAAARSGRYAGSTR